MTHFQSFVGFISALIIIVLAFMSVWKTAKYERRHDIRRNMEYVHLQAQMNELQDQMRSLLTGDPPNIMVIQRQIASLTEQVKNLNERLNEPQQYAMGWRNPRSS